MTQTQTPSNRCKALFGALALAGMLSGLSAQDARAQDTTPMIGEIRSFGFNFCPRGWATTAGQLLPINQNTALFALLGATYGGDGRTTVGLPDLRGRAAINYGQGPGLSNYTEGKKTGVETVTLSVAQMPNHSHTMRAADVPGNARGVAGAFLAKGSDTLGNSINMYATGTPNGTMAASMVANTGGGQPHENRMPYLATTWCIAVQGLFPSRN